MPALRVVASWSRIGGRADSMWAAQTADGAVLKVWRAADGRGWLAEVTPAPGLWDLAAEVSDALPSRRIAQEWAERRAA